MKKLITSITLGLTLGLSAFAQGEQFSQEAPADQVFYENKDWSAQTLSNHSFWMEPACLASTLGDDGVTRLEVISFDDGLGGYTEPLIQVIGPMNEVFFEITAETIGRSSTFVLMPLFNDQSDSNEVAAVSKVEDREALVQAIAQKSRLMANYFDSEGLVKTVNFSLRGSSATVGAMFKQCIPGNPEEIQLP